MTEQLETPAPHPVLEFARRGRGRLEHLHSPASRGFFGLSTLGERDGELARGGQPARSVATRGVRVSRRGASPPSAR